MIVEVYEDSDSTIVVEKGNDQKWKLMEPDAKLIRTIEGKDWNDCMKQHHEIMGWEPYVPLPKNIASLE